MFKEVVSGAIIIGFVLNLAFVDHPDQKSYTIAFVLALLMESPVLVVWWYWWGGGRQRMGGRSEDRGRLLAAGDGPPEQDLESGNEDDADGDGRG